MLASLTKAVKTSAIKKSKQDKEQDVFYWSEGSIAVGRVGETNVSSFKNVKTDFKDLLSESVRDKLCKALKKFCINDLLGSLYQFIVIFVRFEPVENKNWT